MAADHHRSPTLNPSPADRSHRLDPERLRAELVAADPLAAADPSAIRVVRAPGRVNLIGEHTDYNDGLVMPAAIDLEIRLAFIPTVDRRVWVRTLERGAEAAFDLDSIGPRTGTWIDYVAGTARELAAAGQPTTGFRGVLASDLPQGAGLSSSAALELASAWALSGSDGPALDPLALARVAQRAENEYVGVMCGLMDQFAVANGIAGAAIRFDCRSLEHRPVPLPLATHALVVCHSGSLRRLGESEYNARRSSCEAAVLEIARLEPSVRSLRDVDGAMFERVAGRLDDVARRRVRHVVSENARVEATEAAFARGDLEAVGALWAASHASLRDDYEVSSAELDLLVSIAVGTPGVAAARMTGAGFGGSTVNLVARDAIDRFRANIERTYPAKTGLQPTVIAVEPAGGAGEVRA
jgi:galactokinase